MTGCSTGARCGFDSTPAVDQNSGVLVGDSIVFLITQASANTAAMRPVGKTIGSIAISGNLILDQLAAFNASNSSTAKGDPRVRWFYVCCGINNILAGTQTSAQIVADMTTLINAIQAANPNAAILLGKVTPAKVKLDAQTAQGGVDRYVLWQNVNAGYAAAFPALYNTSVSDALNDGADNLAATYDSGDHEHPNTAGGLLEAQTINTWAQGLAGGWS